MPSPGPAALLGLARAAAPRARRSGARSRGARSSAASGSWRPRVMCSWFGCIHSSQPARSMIGAGLAVVVGVRVRADEQLADVLEPQVDLPRAPARGGRASRARASRCRRARSRRPAASAQALQCGTPGHGSGRRRRQTPGSTRSPRPSSRWASRVGMARLGRDGNVADGCRRTGIARSSRGLLRRASPRRDLERHGRPAGSPDGERAHRAARSTPSAPDGVRAFFGELFARVPRLRAEVRRDGRRRTTACAVRWSATRDVHGARRLPGHRADRRAGRARGLDLLRVARRPDRAQRRLRRRPRRSRARSACCPASGSSAERAHDAGVQRPHARDEPRRRPSPSTSPTASGSCAAASRCKTINVYLSRTTADGVTAVRRRASAR